MKFIVLCCFALAISAPAQDARQIVGEAQKRSYANSERYEGTLTVAGGNNTIAEKKWQYVRHGSHGSSKVVLRFTAPAEVKGVALLILNRMDSASNQWMWTPAINRERRIALQDRSTRFFGTDFSFEDLEERDIDQFTWHVVGEETVDGALCWKIESRPNERKTSQYSHSIVWIRKDHYSYWQIENFTGDRLVRRGRYRELEEIQGIWTARSIEMADVARRSRTVLRLEKLRYNIPLEDEMFTLAALRQVP